MVHRPIRSLSNRTSELSRQNNYPTMVMRSEKVNMILLLQPVLTTSSHTLSWNCPKRRPESTSFHPRRSRASSRPVPPMTVAPSGTTVSVGSAHSKLRALRKALRLRSVPRRNRLVSVQSPRRNLRSNGIAAGIDLSTAAKTTARGFEINSQDAETLPVAFSSTSRI